MDQGEKCLAQGIDPYPGVQEPFRAEDEDVLIAGGGAGQSDQVDGQTDKQ